MTTAPIHRSIRSKPSSRSRRWATCVLATLTLAVAAPLVGAPAAGAATAPDAPTNLAASGQAGALGVTGRVTASWTAPAGTVSSYTVAFSANPTFPALGAGTWTTLVSGSSTSISTSTSMTTGTTYYVRVKANNSGASSAWTSTSFVAVAGYTDAPADLAASGTPNTATALGRITASWAAPAGTVSSYTVTFSSKSTFPAAGGGTWSATVSGTKTTFSAPASMAAGTTYYFRVRATNAFGSSTWATTNFVAAAI